MQHTYLRETWKYYRWIGHKNHSKLKNIYRKNKKKICDLISFVGKKKKGSRSIQREYLVSIQHFCYKISMFLPKVESLILQRYSSKNTRRYSKDRKLLATEVNVLSIFLNLGNIVTFCNNVKGFYRTINIFQTEHILSLLYLLCYIFFHFYIFQDSTFCISLFSCRVRVNWKST